MNAPPENRLARKFQQLKERGQKAFVAYITAGDPSPALTPELVWALERAGADIVELGVPFSDPLADGVVNQLSAQRALAAGTTPAHVLDLVRTIREQSQIPLVLYTYFNLLYAFGVERFCMQAHEAGVDGVLILDLPPEEDAGQLGHLARICLVAPTSPAERIAQIVKQASGFIYYVSREGVTGMQASIGQGAEARVALIRKHTALPVCIGFGISTPEQARAVASQADGAVVGSALVNQIAQCAEDPQLARRLEDFARPLAEAIHA